MAKPLFSSAADAAVTSYRHKYTLKHFFVLTTVFAFGLFAYSMAIRAAMPSKFLDAARDGNLIALRKLIASGVDVQYRDAWHTTGLMLSCSQGHSDCVQLLISKGADPNERSRFDRTPLIWAGESGNMKLVKLLLEHGAAPAAADNKGSTAADLARENGHLELANFLESR